MTPPGRPSLRRVLAIGGALLVSASVVYLAASGARVGAPFVFAALAAIALCASLGLLLGAASSLLADASEAEVRVATGRRRKELEREKQALLKALKELAFDHEMKKVSDADYAEAAAGYRARAVRVMRELDEGAAENAVRARLEQDVAARRRELASAQNPATSRRGCPACATDNEPDATFCKRCAARLPEAAVADPGA